jgi:hypothetical protein
MLEIVALAVGIVGLICVPIGIAKVRRPHGRGNAIATIVLGLLAVALSVWCELTIQGVLRL